MVRSGPFGHDELSISVNRQNCKQAASPRGGTDEHGSLRDLLLEQELLARGRGASEAPQDLILSRRDRAKAVELP